MKAKTKKNLENVVLYFYSVFHPRGLVRIIRQYKEAMETLEKFNITDPTNTCILDKLEGIQKEVCASC